MPNDTPTRKKGRAGAVTNSTLARHTELARGRGLASSRTSLAAVNAAQHAKRKRRQGQQAAAFRRSAVCAGVRARCGGQCEYVAGMDDTPKPMRFSLVQAEWTTRGRCVGFATEVHHMSYRGYGGHEDPDRLLACCPAHHALIESRFYPHRAAQRRKADA